MGLDQPFGGVRLTDPDSDGVVVVVLHLGFVFCAAVEGIDYVIGGEGGVRGEDADLQVAEFVGLEFAVLEGDEQGVDGLNFVIDLEEVLGEEAADGGEITFGHGGPKVLF